MTRKRTILSLLTFILLAALIAPAQKTVTAADAKNHIGERLTVCGVVVGTHYAARSRGNPTFINLDQPYPKQIFTVLIWGSDRSKFGDPETIYRDKHICVSGTIRDYKGIPEIIANDPEQIKIQ